jgi:hypothetical protein
VRLREAAFRVLEHEGSIALPQVPEVRDLTAVEIRDLFGTRRGAELLGVSQRTFQRYVAAETGSARQVRHPRPFRVRLLREAGVRALRRAGADRLRGRGYELPPGSTIRLCYGGKDQGERDVSGVPVADDAWLSAFDSGDRAETRGDQAAADRFYDEMAELFGRTLLENYGISTTEEAGDMHVCDDEEDAIELPFTD